MNKQKIANLINYLKYYSLKKVFRYHFKKYGSKYMSKKILDIGGGLSPFKDLLKDTSEYINTDLDEKLHPSIICDAINIPLNKESIDSIICTEVLEHLPEPELCIKEIHRLLKKEGYAYISAPMTWSLHYEPYDYYRFTKYGLKYLFEKTGFKIIKIKGMGGLFSTFGVRLIDIIYRGLCSILKLVLPERIAINIPVIICFPFQIINYLVNVLILDKISSKDVLSWMIIVQKE